MAPLERRQLQGGQAVGPPIEPERAHGRVEVRDELVIGAHRQLDAVADRRAHLEFGRVLRVRRPLGVDVEVSAERAGAVDDALQRRADGLPLAGGDGHVSVEQLVLVAVGDDDPVLSGGHAQSHRSVGRERDVQPPVARHRRLSERRGGLDDAVHRQHLHPRGQRRAGRRVGRGRLDVELAEGAHRQRRGRLAGRDGHGRRRRLAAAIGVELHRLVRHVQGEGPVGGARRPGQVALAVGGGRMHAHPGRRPSVVLAHRAGDLPERRALGAGDGLHQTVQASAADVQARHVALGHGAGREHVGALPERERAAQLQEEHQVVVGALPGVARGGRRPRSRPHGITSPIVTSKPTSGATGGMRNF